MGKFILLAVLVVMPVSFAQAFGLKFVQPVEIEETESLPSGIILTFELACNETLVETIRKDVTVGPAAGKVIINVGGLVQWYEAGCGGPKRKEVSRAGVAFSGREYEIRKIEIH